MHPSRERLRLRKYVQDTNGKTVDGLSFHKSSERYYSIDDDGQQPYWGAQQDCSDKRLPNESNPAHSTAWIRRLLQRRRKSWHTTTMLAALRIDRVEAPLAIDGPMDSVVFRGYVEQMLVRAAPRN